MKFNGTHSELSTAARTQFDPENQVPLGLSPHVWGFRGRTPALLPIQKVKMRIAGIVVGALLFKILHAQTVAGMVGIFAWAFLAQRKLFPPKAHTPPPSKTWGALMSATSGFTSFVSHSGGPPINAYAIPLKLAPTVFTGTMAAYFFVINLSKWLPYTLLGLLDVGNFTTSLVLLPFAPLGVWMGVKIARKISPFWFYRLVDWGMFLTGAKLIWDGFFSG